MSQRRNDKRNQKIFELNKNENIYTLNIHNKQRRISEGEKNENITCKHLLAAAKTVLREKSVVCHANVGRQLENE